MAGHGPVGVRCTVARGGTTRGFLFLRDDLPAAAHLRDELILRIVSGSDSVQADGLGAADMLLSKVVIVWRSERDDVDVECVFGIITPGSRRIKYGTNCGNLLAAVALFAGQEGLCGEGPVCIRHAETGKRAVVRPLAEPAASRQEQLRAMGMPATGTLLELAFGNPVGTLGRGLLPTGRGKDVIDLAPMGPVEVTIVDAGALYVLVEAADLGLGSATCALQGRQLTSVLEAVERLRGQAARLCGLVERADDALRLSPLKPKVGIVSASRVDGSKEQTDAERLDVLARIVSGGQLHGSCAVTGAIAMATASVIPGSIVHRQLQGRRLESPLTLGIGHPGGVIVPRIDWRGASDAICVDEVRFLRSARVLMRGLCYGLEAA